MLHGKRLQNIGEETGSAARRIIRTLIGGVLLLASLVALYLFDGVELPPLPGKTEPQVQHFYADALALAAALLLGVPIVIEALQELWHGHSHMDELVALAFLAAMAMGEYQTAAAIAFFMVLASLIESRTALGARASIESLVRITPTRALRLKDGHEEEVDAQILQMGDLVRVRPGDKIPGDGDIVKGESTVNQAPITGESLPVDKVVGDEVFGGTINETGVLEIRITKAGKDTTLGRVQELILQAERTRIPIMRLMDRYASWYTPTVLMIVGIVLFFTRDVNTAISMLVIATPCALLIAVPTAMVAAISAAARLGIYVKKVGDLEIARSLTAIVFDKTGTLTTGILSVTRLKPADGVDGAELLYAAASAEANSKHPVARAVMAVCRRAKLEPAAAEGFEETPGKGVRATVDGDEVLVGRAIWLAECGIDLEGREAEDAEGLSLLYVTRAGKLLGWIGLEDKTRPEAARSMDELRELGIKQLVMVTGDRASVARRVAAEMHCTEVQAEVLPAQKLELVDALKAQGHVVAVIGDGVNDAPALAAGNISMAMGAAGSDVAIHSASIALMNENLNRVPFLIKLSKRTTAIVRQNLIFGVVFIFGLLAAAPFLKFSPILAAIMHSFAELFVLFNSARLVREGEDLDTPVETPAGGTGGSSSAGGNAPQPALAPAGASA